MVKELLQIAYQMLEDLIEYGADVKYYEKKLIEIENPSIVSLFKKFEASKYQHVDTMAGFSSLKEIYEDYQAQGEIDDCRVLYTDDGIVIVQQYEVDREVAEEKIHELLSDDYTEQEKIEQVEKIIISKELGNLIYERSFSPREDLRQNDEELKSLLVEQGYMHEEGDLEVTALALDYKYCSDCGMWSKDNEDLCYCQTHKHELI